MDKYRDFFELKIIRPENKKNKVFIFFNLSRVFEGNIYFIQNHFIHGDFIDCFSFMGISFMAK